MKFNHPQWSMMKGSMIRGTCRERLRPRARKLGDLFAGQHDDGNSDEDRRGQNLIPRR